MKNYIYNLFKDNSIELDEDIYEYGCKVLKNYLIYFVFLFPIAYLLEIVLESILFIIIYTPLKRYIGGFHFEKPQLCTLFSIITTLIIAAASKYITINNNILIYLIVIFLFLVSLKIGTVDHPNKRLSINEKRTYTKYALIIEVIYFILIILFQLLKLNFVVNLLFFSICFSVGGIIIGNTITKLI